MSDQQRPSFDNFIVGLAAFLTTGLILLAAQAKMYEDSVTADLELEETDRIIE